MNFERDLEGICQGIAGHCMALQDIAGHVGHCLCCRLVFLLANFLTAGTEFQRSLYMAILSVCVSVCVCVCHHFPWPLLPV